MLRILNILIKWLDKLRYQVAFAYKRKNCNCLCNLCTKEDCQAKFKEVDYNL